MWNYRVINESDKKSLGLYEVYYNENGDIFAHGEKPVIAGESLDDLLSTLKMLVTDLEQHMDNDKLILELGDIEFTDIDDGDSGEVIEDIEDFFNEIDDE